MYTTEYSAAFVAVYSSLHAERKTLDLAPFVTVMLAGNSGPVVTLGSLHDLLCGGFIDLSIRPMGFSTYGSVFFFVVFCFGFFLFF